MNEDHVYAILRHKESGMCVAIEIPEKGKVAIPSEYELYTQYRDIYSCACMLANKQNEWVYQEINERERTKIRFGFRSKEQGPLFMIWREYINSADEVTFAEVLFAL